MTWSAPGARDIKAFTRRRLCGVFAGSVVGAAAAPAIGATRPNTQVNRPRTYPVQDYPRDLTCKIDPAVTLGTVDRRIFGTNLEWFNNAGGLDSPEETLRVHLRALARDQKISVFRYPGGTLADYYHWRDGTGPQTTRPVRRHPTDPGRSGNGFGSPEFFSLLRETGAEGLITVNAGTSSPEEAAAWVEYANAPHNPARLADGFSAPANIKLWEVGNELYLPGNPGEQIITQTPDQYAAHFVKFADAMRRVDPSITVVAIGVARSHHGPGSPFADWTERLLAAAADRIDMVAVHNAYFPLLYDVQQPDITNVYPALWAAPEAVDRSLHELETLIGRFERERKIGIAVTEWGALFSLPSVDPYWVDHVKTIGSGVYIARLLQVFMSHPRVMLANYFKFADRSFMGWVGFDGTPKVPYWVFKLYAEATGGRRVAATVDSPTYEAAPLGVMDGETHVAEITVLATQDAGNGPIFVNFVNRSMTNRHRINIRLGDGTAMAHGEIRSISALEPTAHNGVDIPPEWPMKPEYEPYTTAPPNSIGIVAKRWSSGDLVELPPFSVATVLLQPSGSPS